MLVAGIHTADFIAWQVEPDYMGRHFACSHEAMPQGWSYTFFTSTLAQVGTSSKQYFMWVNAFPAHAE